MIFFYVLIFAMPLVRHPLWSSYMGDLTMIKYAGVASFVYALFYLATKRFPSQFFAAPPARWFLLFVAWGVFSYATMGASVPFEKSPFMSYLSFFVLLFVTLTVVDSPQRLRWTLLVAIGSVGFASLHVLREWRNFGFAAGYRPGWVTGDPNYFSLSALLCLPIAYYLLTTRQPKWERWFCIFCLGLTILALVAAASRGGFLGFLTCVLLVAWKTRQRTKVLALCCVVLVPLLLVAPSSPLSRLLRPSYSDTRSTDSRLALWRAGLNMVAAHPIVGVGVGNFKPMASRFGDPADGHLNNVAHNTYLEIAAELGIFAFLIFLMILHRTFRSLSRVHRMTRSDGPRLLNRAALGLQTGLAGCCVSIFFVSAQTQKLFWLVVFLSICLESLAVTLNRSRQPRLVETKMAA